MRLPLPSTPVQVWAVEDTSLQLTWGRLGPGTVTASAAGRSVNVEHDGGPGALDLDGLEPSTGYDIDVSWTGGRTRLSATTVATAPGPALSRVATISDLHLGSDHWGATKLMVERGDHAEPFAVRCARAAIGEAIEWGAELLIIKGDAVHHQDPAHFTLLGQLLDDYEELPVLLIPGNHDVDGWGERPTPAKVGQRGIPYVRETATVDLPGVRVIAADTTIPGQGRGSLGRAADDIVELAAVSPSPALVAIHHQLQAHPIPTHYPIGIGRSDGVRFLTALSEVRPDALVTSGHTHRNRARRHGPVAISEVASVRDWPGVWAGYDVHRGGIRQVVRRVADPAAIGWHEYSSRALLGLWAHWAAGPLDQRCFTHRW